MAASGPVAGFSARAARPKLAGVTRPEACLRMTAVAQGPVCRAVRDLGGGMAGLGGFPG
jgi:hypothetical protein